VGLVPTEPRARPAPNKNETGHWMMSILSKRLSIGALAAKAGAALLAVVAFASSADAQQVVVQGNRRVEAETIRSYIVGSSGSLEDARRNLLSSGLFSEVRISRQGGNVVVVVRENSGINRVAFEGNRKIEGKVLEQEVQTKSRGPYSPQVVAADAERIREIYRRSGRGLATVTPRVVDLPNGRIDVVFTINEGDKTGVKEIRFEGNRVYSSGRLRDLMTTTEMNFLSWIKSSDVYDPDRLAADQELIRRFYLKNGYADFRVVGTDVRFDAAQGGYIITIAVEEGEQYRVADVRIDSRIPDVDPETLRRRVATSSGDVYNADNVERSLTNVTTEVARRGYAFAQVRPVGTRDPATRTIALGYVVEEGPRVYIERINVRGNTRTRDYVIRRELDVGEGDAYNKVLIDRAERRLNNLGYFKRVRITNEPGSAADRVVINIDVEDQPTGSFSIAGGYSTADGFIGEVSVAESNFLGRGHYVRIAGTTGERTRGIEFSFTEPYLLGYRISGGIDLFSKYSDETAYARYESRTTGGQLRLGLPITEEFGVTLRYSLYQQELKIPNRTTEPYNDCSIPIPDFTILNSGTGRPRIDGTPNREACELNGEASIAIKESAGPTGKSKTITSLAGVTFVYSTLDNARTPKNGLFIELRPDFAGLGGDTHYARVTGDARYYYEVFDDVVAIARVQGGHVHSLDGKLKILDHFFLGPSLVRGFESSGIGPRDVSTLDQTANAVGGTTYYGSSLEVQFPIFGLPRDLGLKGAVFADVGTLFGYRGATTFDVNQNTFIEGFAPGGRCVGSTLVQPECVNVRDNKLLRSSVGVGLLWNSPLGPIRFDYAFALTRDKGVIDPTTGERLGADRLQAFRFSGGTRF
jgi:outer membrane protein insertion porin family